MRCEWKECEFQDLYEIPSRNGLSKPSKIRGKGFKMINMGELFSYDRIYDIPMELVPLKETEKNRKIEKYDLLFARQSLIASGAGKCSIVMETSDLTVFESHLIRVRLNQEIANPFFYYYYFKSNCSPIKSIVQHCVQAGIKGSDLAKIIVKVPLIDEQHRIASILSSLDDKIELNNKINENLEQQAQAVFDEWLSKRSINAPVVTLNDTCLKVTDGSHYSPKDEPSSTIPMLSVKDMRKNDFDLSSCKHISEEDFLKMVSNDCVPHIYQPLHQIKHVLASKHWKLKVSSDESSS